MFLMEEDIQNAIEVLQKGGMLLYPTDTVWGIGCDATNTMAVDKIFSLKKRADSKAMIVLVEEEARIPSLVGQSVIQIFDYIKGIHKPTTVIYQNAKGLAPNLIAEDGSIAIRICKELFCTQLLKKFGRPIVSTSANISGFPTPCSFQDISVEIKEGVDYVVRYRQEEEGLQLPSSIIKWEEGQIKIIRP